MHRLARPTRALAACLLLICVEAAHGAAWSDALRTKIERIERASPGNIGVYVKRLDNGDRFDYAADRSWYLGSTVKVLVAIAVLQQVEAGKLRLSDPLALDDGDKIEAGPLVWAKSGSTYRVDALLKRMLDDSDNTASNLLIRTIGEDALNRSARAAMGDGVGRLTSLDQVRYDVYAEIHPDARKLTNAQLVTIAAAPLGPQRVDAVRRALGLQPTDLKAKTIDDAYARYYAQRLNTATLVEYGDMLEKLVRGKLLKPASLQLLYDDMKYDVYTDYRLQAGLPRGVRFIHKTGTQYRRACHAGVIDPQHGGARAIIVATCAANMDEHADAAKVFEDVGRAITQTLLADRRTTTTGAH